MIEKYDGLNDAIHILTESASYSEESKIRTVLEDVESPTTTRYVEKLYDSVISKSHIDFGDIPNSKGNIENYSGYPNLVEILDSILKLASDSKASNVIDYTNTVQNSIMYMKMLSDRYEKGFRIKNDYIMTEYNTFVYTIVQAVSTLLYEFVDYIKKPNRPTIDIVLKNTKYKANLFYIDQLEKFNKINKTMQYPKYLDSILQQDRNNFTGAEILGFSAVVTVALAIVPVIRELIYRFYNTRATLSDCLAQQAYFLEMNRAVVEANSSFDRTKKDKILLKQEKIKNLCLRLSEKLRVNHIKSINSGKAMLQDDNRLLTLDNVKKEVNNSPLELL